jgi:DNA-binding PadR family transcriptional regulator
MENTMALSHAIMTALLEQDMTGYELAKSFDTSLGLFWRASHQQIYQDLAKLQQQGLLAGEAITQQGKPDKIAYTLTSAGRSALERWVFDSSRLQESKDDLFVKLYNLSTTNSEHLSAEIAQRKAAMAQRLHLYQTIRQRHYHMPSALAVRQQGVYLALLAGIGGAEQFVCWCDQALALLSDINTAS